MEPMVNVALRAAWDAENLINRMIDRPDLLKVSRDEAGRPVTNLERSVEEAILAALQQHHPQHSYQARCTGSIAGQGDGAEYLWIIDPLSGSDNLLRGIPHFAFSITCRRGGRTEHALIVDPILRERFSASRGKGAQLGDRRIRVSGRTTLAGAALASACGAPSDDTALTMITNASRHARHEGALIRESGSVGLDLAYLASGRLDGGWMVGLEESELLAGALLIEEAGGLVSDLEGGQRWGESGTLVAATPKCLKPLLQTIRAAD